MIIIPAIDLIDGSCVRLCQGDYGSSKRYDGDPLDVARRYESWGVTHLHVVDLDGARLGRPANLGVLERICSGTRLTVDFGGGVRTAADVERVFSAGARLVTGGSVAVREPVEFGSWLDRWGAQRIALGADAKGGKIAVAGWQETSREDLLSFVKTWARLGVRRVICTDIGRDGMLQGPATELYRTLATTFPQCQIVASGGVSSPADLDGLAEAGAYAAIVGKAIYEGKITEADLRARL